MKTLVVATHNRDKAKEFLAMLSGIGIELKTLDDFPAIGEIPETGETVAENSILKAESVFRATKLPTLADDTGLEVYYLGMAPGVFSSRYAGENVSYAQNVAKLLLDMRGVPARRRAARFRCVLTFLAPGRAPVIAEGICKGTILESPRGTGGFGYDPVFLPDEEGKTFAELDQDAKNRISHRGRAMENLRPSLRSYFEAFGTLTK